MFSKVRIVYFFLIMASVAGAALVLLSTPDGASTSPDSLLYMSVARNLLAGQGYTQFTGSPMALWAPLYSTLLAPVYKMSPTINMLDFVRIVNALIFAAIIFTSGLLFRRYIRSQALVIIATLSVALAYPIIFVSAFVWSEPLFILFYVLFFLVLSAYLDQPRPVYLALLALIAASASVQRYPGVLLIGVGGLSLLLFNSMPLRRRLQQAITFGIFASLPIGLWFIRTYHLTGTLTGPRQPSHRGLRTNISHTYDVFTAWFTPNRFGFGYYDAAIVGVVLIGLFLFYYYTRYRKFTIEGLSRNLPIVLLVIIYPAFFIINVTLIDFTPIDDRYMAPIYVFVMCLVFMALDAIYHRLSARIPYAAYGMIGLVGLWLLVPIARLNDEMPTLKSISAASQKTYSAWHTSDLMQQVRAADLDDPIYTNAPMHILLHTGLNVKAVPKDITGWQRLSPNGHDLVWFTTFNACFLERNNCIETTYTPEDIPATLEPVITASDGAVYRIEMP